MKKLCFFLTFVLLLSMSMGFTTSKDDLWCTLEELSDESSVEDTPEANLAYFKNGAITKYGVYRVDAGWENFQPRWEPIPPEEMIHLNVPKYYQNGQPWSPDIMLPDGNTIGEKGCALTSFTMVVNYYGSNHNPGQVNTTIGDAANPFSWNRSKGHYGVNYVSLSNSVGIPDAQGKTYILGSLRMNRPVIVCLKNQRTSGYHYVVVRGYMRVQYDPNSPVNEYFFIHDPSSASKKNKTYLDDYLFYDSDVWKMTGLKAYY